MYMSALISSVAVHCIYINNNNICIIIVSLIVYNSYGVLVIVLRNAHYYNNNMKNDRMLFISPYHVSHSPVV